MLSYSFGALVVALSLAGASESPGGRCPVTARVDLLADSSVQAPEVCVSADEPTTFSFDTRVASGAVEFQPEGGLADSGLGREGLTLFVLPKPGYLPGERVRITVRFADGTVPESASFWLVGHAVRGTRRVEVYRKPRPADAFKREAADARAEALQCQEEKAQLQSERREPGGLMGAAWLEHGGNVASASISGPKSHPASALLVVEGKTYSYTRTGGTTAVSLSVRLLLANPNATPWTAAGGALVASSGEQVDLSAWQAAPIQAGGDGTVLVGTQREPGPLSCPCTLKLWESPGTRVVTVGNVNFPDGPKPGG